MTSTGGGGAGSGPGGPPGGPGGGGAPPDAGWSWRTPAAITGVIAVVATVAFGVPGLYYARDSADSGRKSADSGRRQADVAAAEARRLPRLKVARISAGIRGGIEGSTFDGHSEPVKASDLRGPHLDITFENRASGPSLITKAVVRFRDMGRFPPCGATGGELGSSANYDFAVPWPLPRTPHTMEKDISFQVEPAGLDRLTLTVGVPSNGGEPWYGLADVVFEHDGGKKLAAGPFAVVDTGADENFHPDGDRWVIKKRDRACRAADRKIVDRLVGTPGVTASRELLSLRTALR
ncbi:hypothetical protein [Streptomyces sp. I05A-00742]|uniref:hypothetical protein n=1 Tax=Streptomyces sp. I05A-00742 TaxID=2732853 RepID=UPI0014892472|nr:hypothetical protein [Streptomyces sp. I05A-00742]